MPLILAANLTVTLLTIAFVIVCALMMLVILIQKPKGGGLSGAFGGAGGSAQAAFGARTGDVLTWVTVIFFVLFLLLAMGLTWTVRPPEETNPNVSAGAQTTTQTTGESDAADQGENAGAAQSTEENQAQTDGDAGAQSEPTGEHAGHDHAPGEHGSAPE